MPARTDDTAKERCSYCGQERREDCDGGGWVAPIGPYRDGSYITSRPCPNHDPYYETH